MRRRHLTAVVVLLVFLALRWEPMARQGLWTDEQFSLAIATGHSLEHPASAARPELGDYVEADGPVSANRLTRYLQHDQPAASLARVLRAARLSDTNPPLYYGLLWAWTRWLGTGDLALRAFSLLAALAGIPCLAFLARRLGGHAAVLPALAVFALLPMSIRYSTEGRMYALVWAIGLAQAVATVTLRRRRRAPRTAWWLWVALGAAGLLTHYFYLFVLTAFVIWLVAAPARVSRRSLALALVAVAAVVMPWYVLIPETQDQWRVTRGWLDGYRGLRATLLSPRFILGELLDYRAPWRAPSWTARPLAWWFGGTLLALLASRRRRAAWLPALWLAAAFAGPVAFDVVLRTHTASVARYSLTGLPALTLLVAVSVARWRPPARVAWVALATLLWLPAYRVLLTSTQREGLPYDAFAREIRQRTTRDDLVIVQSIPGGVAGLARAGPGEAPILSWVEPLGVRSAPRDLERWVPHSGRVAFVSIHRSAEAQPARAWLDGHASLVWQWQPDESDALIRIYELKSGDRSAGAPGGVAGPVSRDSG